jgi:hypothetical protein
LDFINLSRKLAKNWNYAKRNGHKKQKAPDLTEGGVELLLN